MPIKPIAIGGDNDIIYPGDVGIVIGGEGVCHEWW